jgi:hypothetical protein
LELYRVLQNAKKRQSFYFNKPRALSIIKKNIIENIKETNQGINPQGSWQRGTADQNAHQQVGVAIEPTQLASLV